MANTIPVGPSGDSPEQRSKELIIPIPSHISAAASGDYVLQEIKRQEPSAQIMPVVGSTISFFATEAPKEGLCLKRVKLNLFNVLSFEWEQQ